MDAAAKNAQNCKNESTRSVRNSKRIKKIDPSDIKGSRKQRAFSTTTTIQLETTSSSSIGKVASLAGGAICEQCVVAHANTNGGGRNGTGRNAGAVRNGFGGNHAASSGVA